MLIKQLADELGPQGMRVLGLMPGAIETERVQLSRLAGRRSGGRSGRRRGGHPVAAVRRPDEFGRVAAFVLSPAASYVTGSVIPIEGGALRGLLGELGPVELARTGQPRAKFVVPAALHDPALVDDDDQVGVRTVDSRWAITMQVRPCMARSSACWTATSDSSRDARWPRRAPRSAVP